MHQMDATSNQEVPLSAQNNDMRNNNLLSPGEIYKEQLYQLGENFGISDEKLSGYPQPQLYD